MEATLAGCLSQNSASLSCNNPPKPSIKALWTILQIIALIFLPLIFPLSFFHHLRLSSLLPPSSTTLCLYTFPSFSLALVISSLLLNLFLSQSISLLSSILMCECESSLGVLLYFLGSAVVYWNGGLCHFYLLPH